VPPGTPVGKYSFRLNIISVENPDDEFTEGPSVSFEVKELTVAQAPARKFPWWIVALAGVLVLGGGLITWLLIPEKVTMPDMVGMPYQEAVKNLNAVKLKPAPKEEKVSGTQKPGIVIEQNPKAKEVVRVGSEVKLVVEVPPAVPDVIGVPVDKLAPMFKGTFEYQVNDQRVITGKVPIGAIANQSPAAGQRVPVGTKVTLTAEAESVQVPDLRGKPLYQAYQELRSLYLFPRYRDTAAIPNSLSTLVEWQSPEAGTRVAPGATVTVNAVP